MADQDPGGHVAPEEELEQQLAAHDLGHHRRLQPVDQGSMARGRDAVDVPHAPPRALGLAADQALGLEPPQHGVDLPEALVPEVAGDLADLPADVVAGPRPQTEQPEDHVSGSVRARHVDSSGRSIVMMYLQDTIAFARPQPNSDHGLAEDRIPAPWPVSHGSEWMGRPSASPTPGLPARGPNACYDAGESHPHNARTRHVTTPASESIQILGAREHNLKNVSLEL